MDSYSKTIFFGVQLFVCFFCFLEPVPEEMFALEATAVTPLPGNHSMLGVGLFLFLAVYSGWLTFSPIFCLVS